VPPLCLTEMVLTHRSCSNAKSVQCCGKGKGKREFV